MVVRSNLIALEANFKPKINVVYEGFLLNSATQNSEEGIDEFLKRFRKTAASCKYGALTKMIRYRIVTGIRGKASILLLPKEEEYNFDKTLSICWSNEAATKQPDSMIQNDTQTDERVNAVGSDQAKRTNKGRKKKKGTKSMKETKNAKKNSRRCGGSTTRDIRKTNVKRVITCSKQSQFVTTKQASTRKDGTNKNTKEYSKSQKKQIYRQPRSQGLIPSLGAGKWP